MLSVSSQFSMMSGTTVENLPEEEEILEDGEIEDGDEEEAATESIVSTENIPPDTEQSKNDCNDDNDGAGQDIRPGQDISLEESKKVHKKHQRKKKRHRDSKERSVDKKERRRKRKMNVEDGVDADSVHGGSASPHGKKRRKKKKHSRDHRERESTSPESNLSDDHLSASNQMKQSQYYGLSDPQTEMGDYDNEYGDENNPYVSQNKSYTNTSNNNSYYSTTPAKTGYHEEAEYQSHSDSGSDFEAQLAEYKNYKTQKNNSDGNDDYYGVDSKYQQYEKFSSSTSSTRRSQGRRRPVSDKSAQRNQRNRRSRFELKSRSKYTSQERDIPTLRKDQRSDEKMTHYDAYEEYSEPPKRLCRYFAEGTCAKGDDCTFSHDADQVSKYSSSYKSQYKQHNSRPRKRELCKYYLAGHCHHGDNCTYMHGEYPCKYHHSGATCYAGDSCKFSHKPATDETREIIENFKEIFSVDDSWEISELAKVGVQALSKPPPGVGLLPTPDIPPSATANTEVIPSIFDIHVEPSADLQRRIDENSVASLSMTDDSEELPDTVQDMRHYSSPKTFNKVNLVVNKQGLLPTPVGLAPNPRADGSTTGVDGYYDNFYEASYNLDQSDVSHIPLGDEKFASHDEDPKGEEEDFIRIDTGNSTSEEQISEEVKAPDFLPATQKALFMRIHGKRLSADADKDSNLKDKKEKESDGWTYSSEDEDRAPSGVPGVIKIDNDVPVSSSSASVESILKMITSKKSDNTATVDTNLLSKVASVINMSSTTASSASESYNPAAPAVSYNPAQVKASPRHSSIGQSSSAHHRERKSSGSSITSPGHLSHSKHHHHHNQPIRRRLSTQELSKEAIVIPLVAKQGGGLVHSAHPDPRLTLSRLLGAKLARYSASLPRFSKDLILPSSGKMVGLKITLSADDSKSTKRDPRLGRHKDPRLLKSSDPRLKSRSVTKSSVNISSNETTPSRPSIPTKPPALISKSTTVIPSLPELDLDLANINNQMRSTGNETAANTSPTAKTPAAMPQLKLPRLMKAPLSASEPKPNGSSQQQQQNSTPTTIAPYDPRYISSGAPNTLAPTLTKGPAAPYDPRVLSGQSVPPMGEIKKRTIQLPKLTPAPSYKPTESQVDDTNDVGNGLGPAEFKPEGDQGDF